MFGFPFSLLLFEFCQGLIVLQRNIFFGDIVEERIELIEFTMRDGVVFVGVTFGATDGETEPRGCGSSGAVNSGFAPKLLGIDAPFFVGERLAMKSGARFLAEGCAWRKITGDLFDAEFIDGQIGVDCFENPISKQPGVWTTAIFFVAIAVSI